ncbi:MAG: glycogen synthase GlgA [Pseudomonadota bacterium]
MTLFSGRQLKVLFVASEIAPLVKTGGLGDVAGSLPPALKRLGLEVRLVMPLYRQVDRAKHGLRPTGLTIRAAAGWREYAAAIWETRLDGCPVYLLDCPELFDRDGLYGPAGGDYPDNPLRFTWFCRAAIDLAKALDFAADVVHAHDWQTALVMAYLEAGGWDPGPLAGAATVFTIHNLAYQGIYERSVFGLTGLPAWLDAPAGLEFWGNCSLLKAGLVCARALTTVSPSYAQEITTPAGGHGLEGVLASRRAVLSGILNGVDYAVWSPENDPFLPATYSAHQPAGKLVCRDVLLRNFGLEPAGPNTAVIGYVGRLAHQKGVDLFPPTLPYLLLDDVRVCILGSGDHRYEQELKALAGRHPGRLGVRIAFSEELAHLITAGCDLFLMPSRYEPCGLNQIYSLRYGSAPVVRATGGLKDTVEPLDPLADTGTGFLFEGFGVRELLCAAREGLWAQARPKVWQNLQARAMAKDFSWEQSAARYAELYARLRGF